MLQYLQQTRHRQCPLLAKPQLWRPSASEARGLPYYSPIQQYWSVFFLVQPLLDTSYHTTVCLCVASSWFCHLRDESRRHRSCPLDEVQSSCSCFPLCFRCKRIARLQYNSVAFVDAFGNHPCCCRLGCSSQYDRRKETEEQTSYKAKNNVVNSKPRRF